MREFLGDSLIIALGVILAIHFTALWFVDGLLIYENNQVIKGIETAGSYFIIFFGFERFRDDARRRK